MIVVPPDVIHPLCDVWVCLHPGFNSGFLGSLGVDDCCFNIGDVSHLCKELIGKYCDVKVVVAAIIVVWLMRKRVSTIFCSRVMFDQDIVIG